jgi:hypothetical protein
VLVGSSVGTGRHPRQFRQSPPAARVATRETQPRRTWWMPQPSHHSTSLRTSTPPLARNRHMPCPTQRTHAIGLWAARNTAWCNTILSERSAKNSAFLNGARPATHHVQPGAPRSSFGTYLETMHHEHKPACCTSIMHVSPATLRTARNPMHVRHLGVTRGTGVLLRQFRLPLPGAWVVTW